MSLRTGAPAGVAIRNTPTPHLLPHGGNGFPRRCAPRNDIFHGDHLALRRGGAERRPYAHFISFSVGRHPCVPPLDTLCILSGGAHWPRPTDILPTPHPMSRTRRAGCPHPAVDTHHIPQKPVIANQCADWCGNPSPFLPIFFAFSHKEQKNIYAKGKTSKTPCE